MPYKQGVWKPLINADRGTRTLTPSRVADFESAASAIPPHPHEVAKIILT